jgi:hypothetical protein
MNATDYPGIDYGKGQTNIDTKTDIRYGVIPVHAVLQSWCDSSEANYGNAHCPQCGNAAEDINTLSEEESETYERPYTGDCDDYCCTVCETIFGSESAFGEEPLSHYVNDSEYTAKCTDDVDIFVIRSPYYTHAQYCSPCAPGAGYLLNHCPDGPKTYCFGLDWFNEDNPCPYPVWEVSTDKLVHEPKD